MWRWQNCILAQANRLCHNLISVTELARVGISVCRSVFFFVLVSVVHVQSTLPHWIWSQTWYLEDSTFHGPDGQKDSTFGTWTVVKSGHGDGTWSPPLCAHHVRSENSCVWRLIARTDVAASRRKLTWRVFCRPSWRAVRDKCCWLYFSRVYEMLQLSIH